MEKYDEYPYWYKLILNKNKFGKRKKLTIPFIIGSKNCLDKNLKLDNVSSLLSKIINSDFDQKFELNLCPNIGEYVIEISGIFKRNGMECKNKEGKVTLILTESTKILGNNLPEIIESLSQKYSQHISNRLFSYMPRKWLLYDDDDKVLIENSLHYKSKV